MLFQLLLYINNFYSSITQFREFTDDTHEPVNDMVINMYKSKYEEPSIDEGFSAIVKINFVSEFKDPELEKLYRMYLLEK
ncbi:unnamed protein product [Timema podura]|uniref:Uncharacterized protein n=1 Tax=Timema podura TaxID=61482 RepID=A0ABN7PQN0_TIMPD|nr:unnamed protein product [Timema podura]